MPTTRMPPSIYMKTNDRNSPHPGKITFYMSRKAERFRPHREESLCHKE